MKQRLLGAAVLVALMVVFLPMLVKEPAPDSGVSDLSFRMPAAPEVEAQVITLPLGAQAASIMDAPAQDEGPPPTGAEADESRTATRPAAPAQTEPILPPVDANGKYVVHFAAFATSEDADLTVGQLQAHGLAAFTEAITLHGRPAVRVRIGPYQTQAEAEIVRVQAAQVRADVQPRVFMLIDPAAAERTVAALEQSSGTAPERAASGVGFVVQLGAFSNPSGAAALQERLHRAGIVAFTDTVATSRGALTRVNAGPVPSRVEADRLKAKVKSAVEMDGVVRSHP